MRIQYCSDLHLEFDKNSGYLTKNPLQPSGDVLILAGDIIPLHDEYFNNPFFSFISDNFKKVFWVPGNHEFYHKDISEFSSSFNIKLKSNLNIVHNIEIEYENIQFIFSTLWTEISRDNEKNIEQNMQDFDCILKNNRKLKAADYNLLHSESLNFINQSLNNKKNKSVIVTHHLPSGLCNSPVHNNSPINEAFCVDLTGLIEKSGANFWIYGHNHVNSNPLFIGKTLLLTNQLGYVHSGENSGFKHNAYFSV